MKVFIRQVVLIGVCAAAAGCSAAEPLPNRTQGGIIAAEDGTYTLDTFGIEPTAFTVLMYLRREDRAAYQAIPPSLRAAVICDYLTFMSRSNEFGTLQKGMEGPGMHALIEVGEDAKPYLDAILYDRTLVRIVPDFGERNAHAIACKYRRCDYACKAYCVIDGRPYQFDCDPAVRDKMIAQLIAELKKASNP